MNDQERAKRNVEAAVNRMKEGRLVVQLDPAVEWSSGVSGAGEQIASKWKPDVDELLRRTMQKIGLEDAPSDYDCQGMEAVVWHFQEMARQAFRAELRRRHVSDRDAEAAVRRLSLVKSNSPTAG